MRIKSYLRRCMGSCRHCRSCTSDNIIV